MMCSPDTPITALSEAEIDEIVKWPRQNADTYDELARLVAKATAAAIEARAMLAASIPSSLSASQEEILRLHRLLAEARLDADRGWKRYAMANRMCMSYQDERAAALGQPKMDAQAFFAEAARTGLSAKDLAEGVAARTVPGHIRSQQIDLSPEQRAALTTTCTEALPPAHGGAAEQVDLAAMAQDADNYRWLFGGRTSEECLSEGIGLKPAIAQDEVISAIAGFYFSKADVDHLIQTARIAARTGGLSQ